jgi:hypothetical protein
MSVHQVRGYILIIVYADKSLAERTILDYDLYYFCENRKSWVIFPPGFTFESEGDHANAEDPFI